MAHTALSERTKERNTVVRKFVVAVTLLAVALAALPVARALAQSGYPSRPIEFIIPFPPGGPADTAARIIQPHMAKELGVPIVLTNKPGGGGALGGDFVAKSKPDGYTVYATTNSTLTIITAMQPDLTYRPSDFTAVGGYMTDIGVITAKPDGPWKTLDEFVDYAKKNPGKLSYGSAGLGTVSFFTVELFKQAYGLDITHVPFQGTGPVKNAIMGGHVTLGSSGMSAFAPLMKSGDLIGLVSTAPKRLAAFPNVPTLAEKGFPDASLNIWMALFVPAKTPPDVVAKLSRALDRTMKDPAVVAAVEKAGMVVDVHDSAATTKLVESEHAAVSKVVARLGLGKK